MSATSGQSLPNALFSKPPLTVVQPEAFASVRSSIDRAFAEPEVGNFLREMDRKGLRIRNFEAVLKAGLLGGQATAAYGSLDNGDQGQIREHYLAGLERISPELRERFRKLYAYY